MLKKLIRKIIPKKPFNPYIKRKNVEGVHFDFLIGNEEGKDWYDDNCTDPLWAEMRFIRDRIIKPNDVILDCGGHHGCTAILFSHWAGRHGKVLVFEPFPENIAILQRNVKINKIDNIIINECAVGDREGEVSFSNDHITLGASNIKKIPVKMIKFLLQSTLGKRGSSKRKKISVKMVTLDSFQSFKPTVIKLDVQGYEANVLRGAKNILKTRPKLCIEIHKNISDYGSNVNQIFDLIDIDQYQCWVQWEDGAEPEPYTRDSRIESYHKHVHLFAVPK